jgi:hypothetical protein
MPRATSARTSSWAKSSSPAEDVILDRAIHRSLRIELKGESLRKRQALAVAESLTGLGAESCPSNADQHSE